MELVIDCEFNESDGQLLSIALVPADAGIEPFYAEQVIEEPIKPWVAEHVIPLLTGEGVLTRQALQTALEQYLSQFDEIAIIADWPEDIERFCNLMITGPGKRIIVTAPISFHIQWVDVQGNPAHNALSDATAIRNYLFSDARSRWVSVSAAVTTPNAGRTPDPKKEAPTALIKTMLDSTDSTLKLEFDEGQLLAASIATPLEKLSAEVLEHMVFTRRVADNKFVINTYLTHVAICATYPVGQQIEVQANTWSFSIKDGYVVASMTDPWCVVRPRGRRLDAALKCVPLSVEIKI